MKAKVSNAQMRKASGGITSRDKVTQLFYILIRDHVVVGNIEKVVDSMVEQEVQFTNGWIANYAKYLTKRVRNAKKTRNQRIRRKRTSSAG